MGEDQDAKVEEVKDEGHSHVGGHNCEDVRDTAGTSDAAGRP